MSSPELESDHYDAVVLGTGLAESIAAAALAKAGKSVLHLDPNDYYGGEQASLTLDELIAWSNSSQSSTPFRSATTSSADEAGPSRGVTYSHASTSVLTPELEAQQRRYALSLFPAVVPSRGELIDTLIVSDVSKYVSFRLLDSVSVWQSADTDNEDGDGEDAQGKGKGKGRARKVPGSKEEVFKDKSVSLLDKRRLMKFLMFAGGEFENDDLLKGKENQPLLQFLRETYSIPPTLAESITYAIAHCSSADDKTLPALVRTRRYLRSIGRYGSSAFLVGQYGGAGEVAQGFCRACAVFGGTYVLGPSARPESIEETDQGVTLKVPCHPRAITTDHLISSPNHLPSSLQAAESPDAINTSATITAHAIALLSSLPEALRRTRPNSAESGEQPQPGAEAEGEKEDTDEKEENDDTAVLIFPPDEVGEGRGVVRAYIMGEGTGSCPSGQFILYLSTTLPTPSDPTGILRPYLHRLADSTLFEGYYLSRRPRSHQSAAPTTAGSSRVVLLQPYGGTEMLTEGLDWEAGQGRVAYEHIVGEGGKGFFDRDVSEEEEMGMGDDDL